MCSYCHNCLIRHLSCPKFHINKGKLDKNLQLHPIATESNNYGGSSAIVRRIPLDADSIPIWTQHTIFSQYGLLIVTNREWPSYPLHPDLNKKVAHIASAEGLSEYHDMQNNL